MKLNFLFVCLMFVLLVFSDEDVMFARTAARYQFATWRGMVKQSYDSSLAEWNIPPLNLQTNGLNVAVRQIVEGPERHMMVLDRDQGACLLRIVSGSGTNVVSAQELLIEHFANMTTTWNYSSSTNDIGDRGYTIPRGILFTRNNLCVSVRSFTNVLSPESIARQIDADILSKSIRREE